MKTASPAERAMEVLGTSNEKMFKDLGSDKLPS
jgi:hypothetical protein